MSSGDVLGKKEVSGGQWLQRKYKLTRDDLEKLIEQRDQIHTLNLQYLKIDSDADSLLAEFLHDNLTLTTLKLSWVFLTAEQSAIFRDELTTTLNLETLQFSDEEVLEALLTGNNTSVQRLILDQSLEEIWEGLDESLRANLHVRYIDVSQLKATIDYVAFFNDVLDDNKAIVEITFNKNAKPSPAQRDLDLKLARNAELLEILNKRLEQHFHKQDLAELFEVLN